MATAEGLKTLSVTAGAAVRIYRFLQLQTDGKYDEVGTAEDRADGVSVEATVDGDGDTIAMAEMQGLAKVEAGEAIAVGDLIASDTQGRAKTAAAAAAGAATFVLGVARSAASAAGEVVEVQLHLFKNNAS